MESPNKVPRPKTLGAYGPSGVDLGFRPWDFPRDSIYHSTPLTFPNNFHCTLYTVHWTHTFYILQRTLYTVLSVNYTFNTLHNTQAAAMMSIRGLERQNTTFLVLR